jgi:hypothetical protein
MSKSKETGDTVERLGIGDWRVENEAEAEAEALGMILRDRQPSQ